MSDVKIPDISVSRDHAVLYINNGNIYIDDSISKFGTLIQMNDDISVIPEYKLSLQINRILLKFKAKRNCLSFLKCYT
jgi:hypothetical protein